MRRRSAVASTLALFLAAGVALALPASAAPTGVPADVPKAGPVVVVGVPDLRWQDVDPQLTPTLWRLAGRSSVGALTDRSQQATASRPAGWLTLNTGNRAVAYVPPGALPDPAVPAQLQALRESNLRSRFAAQVGALGDALDQVGVTVAAVGGPGAILGGMDSSGAIDAGTPSVAAALPSADVVIEELPLLYDSGRQNVEAVHEALAAIDEEIGRVAQELPANATLLVAGVSDAATGPATLHVAMAAGPSFGAGLLTSASTGRTGVVQLIDVAPTVLWLVRAPVPSTMVGVHWQRTPGAGISTASQVARFVDLDHRSVTALAAARWYYPLVAWTALMYSGMVVFCWVRRRVPPPRAVSAVVASLPASSYLVQLVPWWRVGAWSLAVISYAIAVVLGLAAALIPWSRRGPWRTPAVIGALTAGVVVVDAATGSPLSWDAPFADNPIIAGRFHGVGNVIFSLLSAGTLIASAALATRLRRRQAALAVFGLGALAIAVDGLPSLGDDFGGVLSLLPAVAILGLAVSKVRVSWGYLVATLVLAVTATAAIALYDYSRPPSQRTHLGRFVGQLADGSGWTVVHRKLDTSLGTFTGGWPRWILAGWIVVALTCYLGRRQGWLRLRATVDCRIVGGLLAALTLAGFLGAALNDSGLEIMAFTFYVAAPLLVQLVEPIPKLPPSSSPADRRIGTLRARESWSFVRLLKATNDPGGAEAIVIAVDRVCRRALRFTAIQTRR